MEGAEGYSQAYTDKSEAKRPRSSKDYDLVKLRKVMEGQEFKFYLIHRSGYRALGASRKIGNGYLMFRIHHPSANVYDAFGMRKPFECVGGIANDDIQNMIESGEWDIGADNPYEPEAEMEVAFG